MKKAAKKTPKATAKQTVKSRAAKVSPPPPPPKRRKIKAIKPKDKPLGKPEEPQGPTVAQLLKESWLAHLNRKKSGIADAKRLREEAHALDPDHKDRAWTDEQKLTPIGRDTHQALMAFYAAAGAA